MAFRNVSEAAVEHVLAYYDVRRPAPSRVRAPTADILIGEFEGRRLKVYVERDTNPPKIKTVAWADE